MKLKRRWNERTRLMLTLELAVVLPAAALVILSAVHLNAIQRDRGVEAAFQRDFNQVLAISEKEINQKAYNLADDVRSDFPSSGEACVETMDRILSTHPYIAHIFIYEPGRGLTFRSQPSRLKEPFFHGESEDFSSMTAGWMQVEYKDEVKNLEEMSQHGKPYYFFNNWAPRGEKHLYQNVAMFLAKDSSGGHKAIAGMVFDAEYLSDRFFPEMLETLLSHQEEKGERNHVVLMIHPRHESAPLAASVGWDGGEPEVERNLEGAFPGLTLAIKLHGTTLATLGQHFVHTSFLILGAISLLLTGGIVMTHRNISREMANFALTHVYGIEIHETLARICKINLLLHHDGHTNIETGRSCLDSVFTNARLNPPQGRFSKIVGNPPPSATRSKRATRIIWAAIRWRTSPSRRAAPRWTPNK